MSLSLLSRYAVFVGCVLFTLFSLPLWHHEWLWPFTLLTAVLSVVGIIDLLQSRHSVRRNYPILGNIRYAVEAIRPEVLLRSLTILSFTRYRLSLTCR